MEKRCFGITQKIEVFTIQKSPKKWDICIRYSSMLIESLTVKLSLLILEFKL